MLHLDQHLKNKPRNYELYDNNMTRRKSASCQALIECMLRQWQFLLLLLLHPKLPALAKMINELAQGNRKQTSIKAKISLNKYYLRAGQARSADWNFWQRLDAYYICPVAPFGYIERYICTYIHIYIVIVRHRK